MAVNDNDRVTSRRLKQFWDIAKQWIQSLVSGAIDTSEAAMETSMDTKIQAAKPNYNMPNENDQIGVGYGWNFPYYSCVKLTSYPTDSSLFSVITNARDPRFWNTDLTWYNKSSDMKAAFDDNVESNIRLNILIKILAGKINILPPQMATECEQIISNHMDLTAVQKAYINSTIENDSLIGAPIDYSGHTYQTKYDWVTHVLYVKIDDGEFERVDASSSNPFYILGTINFNSPINPLTFGYIKNNIVTVQKLAEQTKRLLILHKANFNQWTGGSGNRPYGGILCSAGYTNDNYRILGFTLKCSISQLLNNVTVDGTSGIFLPRTKYTDSSKNGTVSGITGSQFLYGSIFVETASSLDQYPARMEIKTIDETPGLFFKIFDSNFYNVLDEQDATTTINIIFPVQDSSEQPFGF